MESEYQLYVSDTLWREYRQCSFLGDMTQVSNQIPSAVFISQNPFVWVLATFFPLASLQALTDTGEFDIKMK